ncbi:hypothetical protein ZHAS_00017693 [Anopheles sinensis]|uniref:Transforming growth factor beta regulator 1 n=1 Tax=Anopheles sinensis TaxID=74873 RepID=A0A084WGW2_ANOSI|nr:hypothetical protein ZHAS_00017693 [Anopheles sinensis]
MQNSGGDQPSGEDVNEKYRRKYCQLKRYMKDMVFENAALSDHIAQVQEKISQRNEERRYMLKKLLDHENELETQLGRPCSKLNELIANSLPPKRQYKKRDKNLSTNGTGPNASTSTEGQDTHGNHVGSESSTVENGVAGSGDGELPSGSRAEKAANRVGRKRGPAGNKPGKKARLGGPGASKKSVQNITLNKSGHPTYPIVVGGFTIQNLGEIAPDRPAYHAEYTIYPIGYCVTRPYGHYKDPEKRCIYTCRVLDDGERPLFEIVPETTDPSSASLATGDDIISGPSTDSCHAMLLQRINAALNIRSIDCRPSGDWFFGLAHPTISSLIQSFPNSERCANYKGIKKENFTNMDKENDPTLNYDALLRHITISSYHTVPEIKEEPPDELFDHSDGNSFSLSV